VFDKLNAACNPIARADGVSSGFLQRNNICHADTSNTQVEISYIFNSTQGYIQSFIQHLYIYFVVVAK
jgi:hypothetical protein